MARSRESLSRAEEVRQRRFQRGKSRASASSGARKPSKRKSARDRQPPVVTRGDWMGVSLGAKSRTRPVRRRYDVALSTPGAEIRLPALPVVSVGWRLLSAVLSIVLGFGIYSLWTSPTFQVRAVEVEGVRRLAPQDLNAVAAVSDQPIFTVDPAQIKEDLQNAFPQLSSVEVQVDIPAKVKVRVVERQPVLAWQQGDQSIWVDSYGVAFPQQGEGGPSVQVIADSAPPAPPASLDEGSVDEQQDPLSQRFVPPQLVSAILAMSTHTPEDTPLRYTAGHGLGWEDKRGWQVYFGTNLDDIEMKLQMYEAILRQMKKQDIHPQLISVEYLHAPYYRLEN